MANFVFFDKFKEYMADGTIDLDDHTFKVYLTNNTPDTAADTVKADLVAITSAGGYADASLTTTWTSPSAGTMRFAANADITWTASGAAFDQFRYVVVYDDTPTSPADPLVGYWDYGQGLTLGDGDSFTLDLDTNYSIFTLT